MAASFHDHVDEWINKHCKLEEVAAIICATVFIIHSMIYIITACSDAKDNIYIGIIFL